MRRYWRPLTIAGSVLIILAAVVLVLWKRSAVAYITGGTGALYIGSGSNFFTPVGFGSDDLIGKIYSLQTAVSQKQVSEALIAEGWKGPALVTHGPNGPSACHTWYKPGKEIRESIEIDWDYRISKRGMPAFASSGDGKPEKGWITVSVVEPKPETLWDAVTQRLGLR